MLSYPQIIREITVLIIQFVGVLLPLSLALYIFLRSTNQTKDCQVFLIKNLCKRSVQTLVLGLVIYCIVSLIEITKADFLVLLLCLGGYTYVYIIPLISSLKRARVS